MNCTAALARDLGQAVQWTAVLSSAALLKRTVISDVTSARKNASVYTFWTSTESSAGKNKPNVCYVVCVILLVSVYFLCAIMDKACELDLQNIGFENFISIFKGK